MHHNFNQNYLMHHGCSRTNEHNIQKRKKSVETNIVFILALKIIILIILCLHILENQNHNRHGNINTNEHRFYFVRFS